MVSVDGVSADPNKVKAIQEWPQPQNIHKVRNFHGLATFYRRFILGFSTIMAAITNYMKNEEFKWTKGADKAFNEIKKHMSTPSILR